MRFVHTYETDKAGNKLHLTAAQVVESTIRNSFSYHAGELETIRSELSELIKVVAAVVNVLDDKQQSDVVSEISWGWKVEPSEAGGGV